LRALRARARCSTATAVAAASLACGMLAGPTPAFAHRHCPNANVRATHLPNDELRVALVCLLNAERAKHELPAVRESSQLDGAAQRWTQNMVATDNLSHGDVGVRVSAAGLRWSWVGEDIASGFSTPRAVIAAWMASAVHCQNILSPMFAAAGVGISPHPVQGFARGPATWTLDCALASGQHAPSSNFGPARGCPY